MSRAYKKDSVTALDIENNLARQIAQQDIKAYTLLESIMQRPEIYVGSDRFDYVDQLYGGYCLGRGMSIDYMPSFELQHWLLHTQSASLHGSISGRTLFYRCFGYRRQAFNQYREFLSMPIPHYLGNNNVQPGIDEELRRYEDSHKIVRYVWEDDTSSAHQNELAHAVIINIKSIISKAGVDYDDVKIYIRKERLFCQVRFAYHCSEGWIADDKIIQMMEAHEHLIAIHANARNTTSKALRDCGCYVSDKIVYDDNQLSGDLFIDEITLCSEYMQWNQEHGITG